MEKNKAIIIDDELSSLQNLQQKLAEFCPTVTVVATAQKPEDAILLINHHKPDVIFLDIEMPKMSGFRMLEELKEVDFFLMQSPINHQETAYNLKLLHKLERVENSFLLDISILKSKENLLLF